MVSFFANFQKKRKNIFLTINLISL